MLNPEQDLTGVLKCFPSLLPNTDFQKVFTLQLMQNFIQTCVEMYLNKSLWIGLKLLCKGNSKGIVPAPLARPVHGVGSRRSPTCHNLPVPELQPSPITAPSGGAVTAVLLDTC